ncbi:phosphatidylinositol-specific phospholipase C/glycerophosphodiester phosphodiesterase family protein [Pedobacter sp. MC2016-14]|uniref:phosphatidylinositol-specific phospholipase C/glycerophosphodiester phosphodiesterase family protein n=1 Tax=Pedobacter sp. MC2016-14 TaxID=2897327 RepID=UPI001E3ABE13|nr:phosphatidylinositol-specific phospholipase C/glycerophosphodiester phosphodiesterase family protein [Pedobacter sp. MC2016-14]MCD0488352.1 phosphatidylinositol-specific phospholipase C/glycerophosphodiester phosphodiesterase family protein [Pedobacter sp. MC2016-14]
MQVAISQKHLKLILFVLLVFKAITCHSQTSFLSQGFAHNDYWHQRPLYDALENGYAHIEADIYLRDGELIVAHLLPRFKKRKTLEQLYFNPLMQIIQDKNNRLSAPASQLTLMIDIKSDANSTYKELELLLYKYKSILSSYENGAVIKRQVTIVITGHKPYELLKSQTYRLAFIDEDLMEVREEPQPENIFQTSSCKYSSLINWQGKGEMPLSEKEKLSRYVSMAHQNGKKVRLWASPENKSVWSALLSCGVDLINTDKLTELRNFLLAREKSFVREAIYARAEESK